MWPLPEIERIKMEKIAHLLNELPLPVEKRNASLELRTESLNRTKDFQHIMQAENLCFTSYPSKENIFIYVGSKEYLDSVHLLADEQIVIIVPLINTNITYFTGNFD